MLAIARKYFICPYIPIYSPLHPYILFPIIAHIFPLLQHGIAIFYLPIYSPLHPYNISPENTHTHTQPSPSFSFPPSLSLTVFTVEAAGGANVVGGGGDDEGYMECGGWVEACHTNGNGADIICWDQYTVQARHQRWHELESCYCLPLCFCNCFHGSSCSHF